MAAFSVCLGGRLDKTGTHANDGSRGEAVGKPGVARVYTNQRLNLSKPWEDLRMTSQGFKPGSGNPTVRHYRGALGNVRHGETETPSCNRKSGNGNPSPTAGRAQFLSQPKILKPIDKDLRWGDHELPGRNKVNALWPR